MIVCHCRGISDHEIHRLVEGGATSAREVARASGAGLRCGGCRGNLKQVVKQALAREFDKAGQTLPASAEVLLPTIRAAS